MLNKMHNMNDRNNNIRNTYTIRNINADTRINNTPVNTHNTKYYNNNNTINCKNHNTIYKNMTKKMMNDDTI